MIRRLPRRMANALRNAVLWLLAGAAYVLGRSIAALVTLTLWIVAAFVAGYRAGRGGI